MHREARDGKLIKGGIYIQVISYYVKKHGESWYTKP